MNYGRWCSKDGCTFFNGEGRTSSSFCCHDRSSVSIMPPPPPPPRSCSARRISRLLHAPSCGKRKRNCRPLKFSHNETEKTFSGDRLSMPTRLGPHLVTLQGCTAKIIGGVRTRCVGARTKIRGDSKERWPEEVRETSHGMQINSTLFSVNDFSYMLDRCIKEVNIVVGKEVHHLIASSSNKSNSFLRRKLIHMFAWCGSLVDANQVFGECIEPDVYIWTVIISAHAKLGANKEAIALYHQMMKMSVEVDGYVFVAVLQACAKAEALLEGLAIHVHAVETGFEQCVFVGSSLIDMYVKCTNLENACYVFDRLCNRNLVTWNVMLNGFSQSQLGAEALKCFYQMQEERLEPDAVTLVSLFKVCGSMTCLKEGISIHALAVDIGLESQTFVGSTLIGMYANSGDLDSALIIFNRLQVRTVVTWNTMIGSLLQHGLDHEAYKHFQQMEKLGLKRDTVTWNAMIMGKVQCGHAEDAFHLFGKMQEEGMELDDSTYVSMLKACAKTAALDDGKKIHYYLISRWVTQDVIVGCALIDMYAKCGALEDARQVFEGCLFKNVVHWNTMIAGYARFGNFGEALSLFKKMQEGIKADNVTWNSILDGFVHHRHNIEALQFFEGMIQNGKDPDNNALSSVLKACSGVADGDIGRVIHFLIVENNSRIDIVVQNSLIGMYIGCGYLEDACNVFDNLPRRDVVTWSTLIGGYADHESCHEAIKCFWQMIHCGIEANAFTFTSVLKACSNEKNLEQGKVIHVRVVEDGFDSLTAVGNSLINMYAKCASLADAEKVFEELPHRDVLTWTSIIGGYIHNGENGKALRLHLRMEEEGMEPDDFTLVYVLKACSNLASLNQAKWIHTKIKGTRPTPSVFVANALIDMYVSCGSLRDAHDIFVAMLERDLVTWNTMIRGFVSEGCGEEALILFWKLQDEVCGIEPNFITYINTLKACSTIIAVDKGRAIHGILINRGFEFDSVCSKALIDMYAKCGRLGDAQVVFNRVPEKDAVVWSALMAACAHQSGHTLVLRYFEDMQLRGIDPDSATFVALLSSCSHVGLVDEGFGHFKSMTRDFGITPKMEHFNGLIDLLGRAGCFDEAEDLLHTMPFQRNTVGWICLLAHCRTYCNLNLASWSFECLRRMHYTGSVVYVLMSQIYNRAHRQEDAANLEYQRIHAHAWKKPGKAFIIVNDRVHTFIVGDRSHNQIHAIYAKLERLDLQMERFGYLLPSLRLRLAGQVCSFEEVLSPHCEMLAIAFGLINTPHGTVLNVFKNLRMCTKCHSTAKVVSKLEKREIILTDSYRIHHFKDGTCSCNDYF